MQSCQMLTRPPAANAPRHEEAPSREHVLDMILHLSASWCVLADEAGLARIAYLLHEVNEEAKLEQAIAAEL